MQWWTSQLTTFYYHINSTRLWDIQVSLREKINMVHQPCIFSSGGLENISASLKAAHMPKIWIVHFPKSSEIHKK